MPKIPLRECEHKFNMYASNHRCDYCGAIPTDSTLETRIDRIPSREWLLGWFEGYKIGMQKNVIYYALHTKEMSRQELYDIYLKIKGE